ncbi:MAG TPA: tetratricopeptide repeat protein [Polyangiaceae bacterium]|nr:tetratricopeptide repeat protein [Polyangiaceae bacterium]
MHGYGSWFRASLLALTLSPAAAWGQSAPSSPPAKPPQQPDGSEKPPDGKPQAPKKPSSKTPRADLGLSAETSLARATAFYEAGQYAQCADAFGALLDDPTQASSIAPRAREQASVYRAACLVALGRGDEADETFRRAIRENPQMAVPNAIVFPPAVIERFIVVRTTLMEEIRRADEERAQRERQAAIAAQQRAERERIRVQHLELLASQETLVVQNQRWIAWVPFGVGQFQNRDYVLGGCFLAAEVLLAGTAITATSIELSLNAQAKGGAGLGGDVPQLNKNIRAANEVGLIATSGFILVAGLGILQANLAFVPEFPGGVRQRTKPTRAASPSPPVVGVAPMPGGAAFSVFGRF